jgi:hypothetical protein
MIEEEQISQDEDEQWYVLHLLCCSNSLIGIYRGRMFDYLFQMLVPHILLMFPSSRISAAHPGEPLPSGEMDNLDQPVWQFLATLAVQASVQQHQTLVTLLREKILENVAEANKSWTTEEGRQVKLANISMCFFFLSFWIGD